VRAWFCCSCHNNRYGLEEFLQTKAINKASPRAARKSGGEKSKL
jgi:hypothetical protein